MLLDIAQGHPRAQSFCIFANCVGSGGGSAHLKEKLLAMRRIRLRAAQNQPSFVGDAAHGTRALVVAGELFDHHARGFLRHLLNRLIDFGDIQAVNQVECIDRAESDERDILRNAHALVVNRTNSTDSHHVVAAENRRDFRVMLEQLEGQVIRAARLEIAVSDVFLLGGDAVRFQGIYIAV